MKPRADTALLILDMLNLFDFEDGPRLAKAAAAIAPRIARLRGRFDLAGAPTIHVNDNFSHWQGEFREMVARCLEAGGHPAAIAGHLAPRSHDYHVLKPKHSGFLATPLAILLAKLGIRRLVLTGIAADSCVLATAQDANMREYRIWSPRDCVAAISGERKERALKLMASAMGAEVAASTSGQGIFPRQARGDAARRCRQVVTVGKARA